jgi:hypothetical protein
MRVAKVHPHRTKDNILLPEGVEPAAAWVLGAVALVRAGAVGVDVVARGPVCTATQ